MKQLQITQRITNRDEDSLDIYLNSISKEKSITPEEEKELARRIHQGDKQALDKLVRANLRFVVSVAKAYQDQGMGLSDLISEGNIGLVKAAEAFDEKLNVKFISYAVWWIRQSIMQALTDYSRQIRLPHNQDTLLRNVRRTFNRIEQREGRPATVEEVAEELDMDEDKLKELLQASRRNMSLDEPLSDEDGGTLLDVTPDETSYYADMSLERESLHTDLEEVMGETLKPRDIYVLKHAYGIGCTQCSNEEISHDLGLTRERVRQIGERAIQKLRKSKQVSCLRAYA
ncbi:MAG: RNA polymerase sigma factor RpoD/SigA [Bacteroidales bacterium]|nr:RNA polymerase sigma factor RpoD/SigA [Bacteroidales bacterium]